MIIFYSILLLCILSVIYGLYIFAFYLIADFIFLPLERGIIIFMFFALWIIPFIYFLIKGKISPKVVLKIFLLNIVVNIVATLIIYPLAQNRTEIHNLKMAEKFRQNLLLHPDEKNLR